MSASHALLGALALSVVLFLSCRRATHLLQLESYQLPGYGKSLRRSAKKWLAEQGIIAAVGVLLGLLHAPILLCLAAELGAAGIILERFRREKQKKPLVITERVKRLWAVYGLVTLIASWLLLVLWPAGGLLMPLAGPLLLALANGLALPMERHIANQFMADARKRLAGMPHLIRIGITGSYGKTSTKMFLRQILSVRWNVLATPGSYNTSMGVTRVIREQLMPSHQVFIAEMGARHVGDIRELTELVQPTIGILTSIGPQHLDTFGSIERVRDTKNELMQGLPADGTAIFARDGGYCEALYAACPLSHKLMPGDLVEAKEIQVGAWGTRFILRDVQTGEEEACETRLLGKHAVSNLMLCATAARALGLSLAEIAEGIRHCQPVEHRLQLLDGGNGISVIDDAFNANPSGAEAALEALAAFPGRRILVTPGMVELGDREAELNRAFGRQAAGSADVILLVGKRHTKPIAEGLTEAGFPKEQLHSMSNLQEATSFLSGILQPGDVVLYENDLPDNYEE